MVGCFMYGCSYTSHHPQTQVPVSSAERVHLGELFETVTFTNYPFQAVSLVI